MRLDACLKSAVRGLTASGSPTPWLDAELLVGHVLGVPRAWLLAHHEAPIAAADVQRIARLVRRRSRGEPIAYLLGKKEFYGRWFAVNPTVMIPRPETETLIEIICQNLGARHAACHVADIGTGCGNLAVTLARELPRATVRAVDSSRRALRVARQNALRHRALVHFHAGDLAGPLTRHRLDAVVANLPYLDRVYYPCAGPLGFEPARALWSPQRGLAHYRRLLEQISRRRQRPRLVACEMNQAQVGGFRSLARKLMPRLAHRLTVVNRVAFFTLTAHRQGTKPS